MENKNTIYTQKELHTIRALNMGAKYALIIFKLIAVFSLGVATAEQCEELAVISIILIALIWAAKALYKHEENKHN